MLAGNTLAEMGQLDLIEAPGANMPEQVAIDQVRQALLAADSGIQIVAGSERFVGRIGDGANPNLAQSATFEELASLPHNLGGANLQLPGKGVLLTSGVANLPTMNTSTSFGVDAFTSDPISAPNEGDFDDRARIGSFGNFSSVNNLNLFELQFTVAEGQTSIAADFVFASDEFPDQTVSDIFVFVVDGVNYARFPDGSTVSFLFAQNEDNFNSNLTGEYDIEYDGVSNHLRVVGLLDPAAPDGVHTLTIAIANTSDTLFDSGVFIGGLAAGTETGGGIGDVPDQPDDPPDDEPDDPPLPITPDPAGTPEGTPEGAPAAEPTDEQEESTSESIAEEITEELLLAATLPPTPTLPPIDIAGGGSFPTDTSGAGDAAAELREPRPLEAAISQGFAELTQVDFQASQPAEKQQQLLLVVAETDVPESNNYVEGDATPLRKPPPAIATQLAVDLPAPDPPGAMATIIRGQSSSDESAINQQLAGDAPRPSYWWLGAAVLSPLVLWGGWQRWVVRSAKVDGA